MEDKMCNSCKRKVANDRGNVRFPCPSCTKYEIVRCSNCRTNAIKFVCPQCGFIGPN